jgi:hypothetical protein
VIAASTSVVILVLRVATASQTANPSAPALGTANPLPDRGEKPWKAIEVAFDTTNKPLARGSLVTLVPADRSLPTIAAHVKSLGPDHDDDQKDTWLVRLDPIRTQAWLDWAPRSMNYVWYYPRVMILPGDVPAARALAPKSLTLASLPKGTRAPDVILAVDVDGDQSPDVVARRACGDGGTTCEDGFCDEVWVKADGAWTRRDRTCGD